EAGSGRGFSFAGHGVATEALQLSEGAVESAVGGIDAALEVVELVARAAGDLAERGLLVEAAEGIFGFGDFVGPELGLDAAEAAELPIGAGNGVDEQAFGGSGGLPFLVVIAGEGLEQVRILTADDMRPGVNAGFQGVEPGDG